MPVHYYGGLDNVAMMQSHRHKVGEAAFNSSVYIFTNI